MVMGLFRDISEINTNFNTQNSISANQSSILSVIFSENHGNVMVKHTNTFHMEDFKLLINKTSFEPKSTKVIRKSTGELNALVVEKILPASYKNTFIFDYFKERQNLNPITFKQILECAIDILMGLEKNLKKSSINLKDVSKADYDLQISKFKSKTLKSYLVHLFDTKDNLRSNNNFLDRVDDQQFSHPLVLFFIRDRRRKGTSLKSINNNYVYKIKDFFNWLTSVIVVFKDMSINEITVADISNQHLIDYRAYLLRQVSKGERTINGAKRHLQYLKCFFRTLFQNRRIPFDIARSVPNIKASDYIYRDIPEDDELQVFFETIDCYSANPLEEKIAYLLMIDVGLRGSEVVNLKWSDVNLVSGTIAINDTKGENKLLPLPDVVVAYLKTLQNISNDLKGRIISFKSRGYLRTYLYQMFKIYCLVCEIKVFGGPHLFRHAFITRLSTVCTVGQLMYFSRHSSLMSLPKYVHTPRKKLVREIKKITYF